MKTESVLERIRKLLDGRILEWARRILLPLALLYAASRVAKEYHQHYPIHQWLVWRYAGYWIACAAFTVACISGGHRARRLLGLRGEGLRAELLMSFGLCVLLFFWCVFLLGLAGLLKMPVFFALPVAMAIAGGRPGLKLGRRCVRAVRLGFVTRRKRSVVDRVIGVCAAVFGVTALLLLYLQTLAPENVSFDARWYHLGMAEHYVSQGAIRRFPEGWFLGAFPQLGSLLYAWAFLFPTGHIFDRTLLAVHLELTLFLWTLAGVSAVVHRLVPRVRPRFAWVGVFLFPGLFVYDSSFIGGADHIVAFWAPLIFLALLRAWSAPSARSWLLASAFVAGAALTKYTAMIIVVFPVLALVARCLIELAASARRRRMDRRFWLAPAALLLSGLVLTAPHWLKNWLWYGNPIYPRGAQWFTNRPWSPEAARVLEQVDLTQWSPQGTTAQKLKETLKALYTFSFEPHDFPKMHGAVPVFGSLFTVCLFALPFLRGTKRVWALAIGTNLGVFCWYWTQHEDRYLQALVPWMAAVVVAVAALAWSSHVIAKAAVAVLVGLQIAWGSDLPFLPIHSMVRPGPLDTSLRLIGSGYRKEYAKRLDVFSDAVRLGKLLPKDAHLLLHDFNPRLGINRAVVTDSPIFQGALYYSALEGPKALHDLLRSVGVTHVAWLRQRSRGAQTYAGDLVFFDFLARHTTEEQSAGAFQVARLIDAPNADGEGGDVLYLGCSKTYAQGVYRRTDMAVPTGRKQPASRYPKPRIPLSDPAAAASLVEDVRYVVFEPKCSINLPAAVNAGFINMATRDSGGGQLWVRKPAGAGSRSPAPPAPASPKDDLPFDPSAPTVDQGPSPGDP
jgi:hypothetical protein